MSSDQNHSAQFHIKSRIRDPFILLDARIEDIGLDPYTYRLYARFVYRARNSSSGHFESQENVSKAVSISERKIRDCIKTLQAMNLIEVERRGRNKAGHYTTSIITLTDPSEWLSPLDGKQIQLINKDTQDHRHVVPPATGTTCRPPAAPRADITRSQKELDPNLTIMCEEKSITTQNKESRIKDKYNSKHDEKLKRLQINLSLAVCESLKRKFVSNDLCGEVLKTVFQKTDCSVEKMIDVVEDVKTYHFLKSDLKSDLINDLTNWIHCREDKIQKINNEKEIYDQEMLEQRALFEAARDNLQEKNSREYRDQDKQIIDSNVIEFLPENFKSWYKVLPPISKKEIIKEINQLGIENFVKMRMRHFNAI